MPNLSRRQALRDIGLGIGTLGAASSLFAKMAIGKSARRSISEKKPNIIIIFTDDQGYNDLSCYGNKNINTQHIDQMAAEGMRFIDFHVTASVCSPSRAALLTGCYHERVGMPWVVEKTGKNGLNPEEVTIAGMLKKVGYKTAVIGKWHLGHACSKLYPKNYGFDYYFGLPFSNDMFIDKLMSVREQTEEMTATEIHETLYPKGDDYLRDFTLTLTTKAVDFIKKHTSEPFFVYLPHTSVHDPQWVPPQFVGESGWDLYGDNVHSVDWSTGQILQTLKEEGIDDNTLVIFTSDNGSKHYVKEAGETRKDYYISNAPLRGGKWTPYEGGTREPCVIRWPGKIPGGTVCNELCTCMDFLPTIAMLAASEAYLPTKKYDGKNIWPLLSGQPGVKTPYEEFVYYRNHRLNAVRKGKYKLLFNSDKNSDTPLGEPVELYDLDADVGESKNLISDATLKDTLVDLIAIRDKWKAELGDSLTQGYPAHGPGRRGGAGC